MHDLERHVRIIFLVRLMMHFDGYFAPLWICIKKSCHRFFFFLCVFMSVYIIAALRFFVYSMTLMMMSIAGDLLSALVISACQTMSPAKDQRQRKMMYIMMSLVLSFSLSLSRTLFLFYVGTCIS